jgi:hypothetical protein
MKSYVFWDIMPYSLLKVSMFWRNMSASSSGLKTMPSKKPVWSRQEANHVVCENIGLFRNRKDLESQPIGSYVLCQRTNRRQEKID